MRLQSGHKAKFVLGAGAGEDVDIRHLQRQLRVVQLVQIGSGQHAMGVC